MWRHPCSHRNVTFGDTAGLTYTVRAGDIGEVQGDARSAGDTAAGDDGGYGGKEQQLYLLQL
jgi:hypothetical protein